MQDKYVIRQVRESTFESYIRKTVKFCARHVIGIKNNDRRKLVFDGKLNSEKHISLMLSNLLTDYEDEEIFQHHGTFCQTSRVVWSLMIFNF